MIYGKEYELSDDEIDYAHMIMCDLGDFEESEYDDPDVLFGIVMKYIRPKELIPSDYVQTKIR